MSRFSAGQAVKAKTTIHRITGSAFKGDKGRITRVTGDGVEITWSNGSKTDVVKDHEIESA